LIHRQLDPAKATQWRAWVALALCAVQGARQNAVLHLQADDVTLGFMEPMATGELRWHHGEIVWRAPWDKMGRERAQPLRLAAQMAIEIALEWRERSGYDGPWLLPPVSALNKGETYDQQSLWWALQRAEERAGLPKVRGQAAHSLRRMLAGDIAAASGNFLMGLRAIGDTDPRRAAEYIQDRDDQFRTAFTAVDGLTDWEGALNKSQRTRNTAESAKDSAAGISVVTDTTKGDTNDAD
ncbi:MAG: site-specific integrase, partial [Gemmatimonadaceae bacterium]|nr:site-specific integrase [Gemmatimonadaceae bacterium]